MSLSLNYPTLRPTLALDFLRGALAPEVTFTRASTGTYFDVTGVLRSADNNVPRFDYNPATSASLGLLIEEARTNSIRNNTMQGAAAGTPGTLPTNWSVGGTTTGLTREIVGTGTENGITYIDIRFSGTAGALLNPNVIFEVSNAIAALNGQTWTSSFYLSLVGGSLTNVTNIIPVVSMFNSTPALVGTLPGPAITPTNAALRTQRNSFTTTLNQAATAFAYSQIQFSVANGAAIDITLRIGLPQLELGAFATSVIPTTTTALTRAADVATINTLSPWYNAAEGTLYAESSVNYTVPGTSFPLAASFNDNTANNRIEVGYLTASVAGFEVFVSNVSQAGLYPPNANVTRRTAGAYAANDFAVSTNGSSPATDTSGSVPTVNRFTFGGRLSSNTIHLLRITYYPRRLSNAELQALTT
jgi:hypothetical protein